MKCHKFACNIAEIVAGIVAEIVACNIADIVAGTIVGQNGMRKSVSQTRESQTRESSSSSTSTAIVNINDTTG